MDILEKLFDFLKSVFTKIVGWIRDALPYIALGLAIYFMAGGSFVFDLLGSTLTFTGVKGALLAVGASFLLAPGETSELVSTAAEAVIDVGTDILVAGVGALTTVAGAALGSPLLLIGGGLLLLFFLGNDRKKREIDQPWAIRQVAAKAVKS